MSQRFYEDVAVEGHLIDSQIVSKMMDDIIELGGEFETLSFDVGRTNDDPSRAVLRVIASDQATLDNIITAVLEHGAVPVDLSDASWSPAPADGVFPEGFYSTTNMETWVRIAGTWVKVAGAEMDLGIRVDPGAGAVELVAMNDVRSPARSRRLRSSVRSRSCCAGQSRRGGPRSPSSGRPWSTRAPLRTSHASSRWATSR
jgi:hypothetical protein